MLPKYYIKKVLAYIWPYIEQVYPRRNSLKGDRILVYHSVHPSHPWAVRPKCFHQQMKLLSKEYRVVSLEELISDSWDNSLQRIAITFDDGYEDNYLYAFPSLVELNIPATIFLATGCIRPVEGGIQPKLELYPRLQMLKWNQCREMATYDINFGPHTKSHVKLSGLSTNNARKEIYDSKRDIEQQLGIPGQFFSFPEGRIGSFRVSDIRSIKRLGFLGACTTVWGVYTLDSNVYTLPRISVKANDNLKDFKAKLDGNWDYLRFIHKAYLLQSF